MIANGYVYVASDDLAYAVEIGSQTAKWTGTGGGWLSVASHRLLVARADGVLDAYMLAH